MKKQQKKLLEVGLGIAGVAAAAAAGAYLLTGKHGEKNRKKVSAWATKAKKEIVSELKSLEKVSKKNYEDVIKSVSAKYKDIKNVDPSELQSLVSDAKGHWANIAAELKAASSTVSQVAKKVAPAKKKATPKKAAKPAAKKRQ